VLREHGFRGERVLKLARKVANDELRRRGAYLGSRYEDLVSYLAVVACASAIRYDESRVGPGYTFGSYLYDVMAHRVTDFYRTRREGFADTRYNPEGSPVDLSGDRIDTRSACGEAPDEVLERLEEDDLGAAAHTLCDGLSPSASFALVKIVRPLAEGASVTEASKAAGVTLHRARLLLAELREELEAAGVGDSRILGVTAP
jgi:hypothetical protein